MSLVFSKQRIVINGKVTIKNLASSGRSVSQGAAQKMAHEKIGRIPARKGTNPFSPSVAPPYFCATTQLAERIHGIIIIIIIIIIIMGCEDKGYSSGSGSIGINTTEIE